MSGFYQFISDWILGILNGFDANVQNAVNVLSTNVFDSGSSMYKLAIQVSNVVKPIALTLITLIFLLEFLKLTIQMDILKYEYFFRVVTKFIMAKVCIDASFKLMSAIYATGAEWISKVGKTGVTLGSTVGTLIETELKNMGFWDMLGISVSMVVVMLAIKLVNIMVVAMAYARMFEIYALMSVSPLPCAFLPSEDSRIPKKFFMNFASVCLKGFFMIFSIKMYGILVSDTFMKNLNNNTSVTDMLYNVLLASLVLIVAIIQSGQWAKSTLDAM